MKNVKLGSISDIPAGEGRAFVVDGEEIAVFHARNGEVYATQSRCPHRNGSLIDGLMGVGRLTCPMHEWTFDLTSGEPLTGECGIKLYPIRCGDDGTLELQGS